jgi:hypothetical protein
MKKLITMFIVAYSLGALTGCGSGGAAAPAVVSNPSIHGSFLITATSNTLSDTNGKQLPGLLVSDGGTEVYDVAEET